MERRDGSENHQLFQVKLFPVPDGRSRFDVPDDEVEEEFVATSFR